MRLIQFFFKLFKYTFNGYLFVFFICKIKGIYYTKRYCDGIGRIVFQKNYIKLRIDKHSRSKIILNGNLILASHCGGRGYVTINLMDSSELILNGDFNLGQNIKIHVHNNAKLSFGGRKNETASGITCDSMIMCYNKIEIGQDLICGWNVYITDSDWHTIIKEGRSISHHADLTIGHHVWIGSNVIIGKGAQIGNNCIVGAYSKISQKMIEDNSTLVGSPVKIISKTTDWKRDI